MRQTLELVAAHLLPDISAIVVSYFTAIIREPFYIARAGEWETCLYADRKDVQKYLYGAFEGGHLELAELMFSRGGRPGPWGFYFACKGGNKEIVKLLMSHGATHLNPGLLGACKGGHEGLVRMMIYLGADDWNGALLCACKGGHAQLANDMISSHGAGDFAGAIYAAYKGGHVDLAENLSMMTCMKELCGEPYNIRSILSAALNIAVDEERDDVADQVRSLIAKY